MTEPKSGEGQPATQQADESLFYFHLLEIVENTRSDDGEKCERTLD